MPLFQLSRLGSILKTVYFQLREFRKLPPASLVVRQFRSVTIKSLASRSMSISNFSMCSRFPSFDCLKMGPVATSVASVSTHLRPTSGIVRWPRTLRQQGNKAEKPTKGSKAYRKDRGSVPFELIPFRLTLSNQPLSDTPLSQWGF